MAYTKTPEQSTYSSKKLSLCYSINTRQGVSPGLYDEQMVNLIPKKGKDSNGNDYLYSEGRDIINAMTISGAAGLAPRGCYVWEKSPGVLYYYAVFGTKVFTSQGGTSWSIVDTLLTNVTTPVAFTEFIDSSTNAKSLILVDGTEGYVYTTDAPGTKITDADFPSPHLPFPVFIDGYLFLAKEGTGDIYNSNLNNPTAWTAGDFISSELYPDDLTAILKINNYLLAVGKLGCEYFYDAASTTGSPLARYEGGNLPFGCPIPTSIAINKNIAVMIANNSDGELTLKVIEDFKHKDISTSWFLELLNTQIAGGIPSTRIRGYFIRQLGELMYVIKLDANNPLSIGVAYCFSTGYWIELAATRATGWPVVATSFGTTKDLCTFIQGVTDQFSSRFFGRIGLGSTVFTTGGGYRDYFGNLNDPYSIHRTLITPNFDFDSLNTKTMSRLGIGLTISGGGFPASSSVVMQYTDDDYRTWSSARYVEITNASSAYTNFPFITQLGQFRQRAFRFIYTDSVNIRFKWMEVDINKGQQ